MNHAARENTEHAYIGRPVRRTEDSKLLQGKGSFVDDLKIPGVLHMAVLRSPHAHARIVAIDTSQASAMEGVFMVWTEADLPPAAREPMPILVPNPAIRQLRAQRVLACGEVCAVGDPVAFVVAQNRYLAEDACDRIVVEYEELPVASNALESLKPGSPTAHLGAPDNLAAHVTMGFGDVAAAFEGQCVRVKETFWQNRGSAHPMETRGYLAELHPSTGELTVWSSGQAPHLEKKSLIELLAWDPEKLRVIMLDVGGGFGPKAMFYPEEAMVCVAACALGRPVKWIEDRREHFLTATQERDQWWTIEVAFENDGCIRGVRLEMVHDNGAWLPWGIIMPWISVTTTPGPYVIPAMSVDLQVVFTNKGPTSRCAGQAGPRRSLPWSAFSTAGRIVSASIGLNSGSAISSSPSRCPTRWASSTATGNPCGTTAGTIRKRRLPLWSARTTQASLCARERHAPRADSSASDWPTMSKALASGHSKGRPFGSSRTAESPCSPAHRRRARATRRPLHRFVQTSSVCLST